MRYLLIATMTLLSFSINAKTTYNIYKNDCLLEIRRSSDSLLIGSYNLDVLVWQSTISSDGFQLSDQIHSWSSPLHYIDNYTDSDSLFTNLMTWKNECIAAQGGADSLYSEYSSSWLLNGDTIYSKIVDLNGDTLIIGSDTVIVTGGASQTLAIDTSSTDSVTLSISGGNAITFSIEDLDSDSTNEIQTLGLGDKTDSTQVLGLSNGGLVSIQIRDADYDVTNEIQSLSMSNDTIYLEDGGFVVLPLLWESTTGDTIEPVDKDAVMSIFDLFGEGEFEYISPQGFKLTNKPTIVAGQEFETFKIEFNDTSSGRIYALGIQRYPAAFDPTRPYEVSLGSTNFTTFEADVVSISEKNGIKLVRNSSGNTPISHIILSTDSTVSIFADSIQLNNENAAADKVLKSLDGDGWTEWSNTFITTSDTASLSTPTEGHIIYCTDCTNDDATTGSVMVGNGTIWRKIKYQ